MKKFLFSLFLGTSTLFSHAQTSLSNAIRVNLQSPEGLYISATRNFVPSLQANIEKPGMYEFFVLEDVNGGSLQSGDAVRIYAHSGYVSIQESNDLLLAATKPQEMLTFQIERADGPGAIRNHEKVYLKTTNGTAVVQEGNGVLKVSNGTPLAITLSIADVNAGIAEAFAQDWKAGWGITFDNSPQGMAGKKLQSASTLSSLSGFRNGSEQHVASSVPKTNGNAQKPVVNNTPPVNQTNKTAASKAQPGLPVTLPIGLYKCYVDHVSNVALAGYFTLQAGGKYIFHGYDANKKTGTEGAYTYDQKTGKIAWLSGSWKTNNYYGIYSLDATYGNRIYLIPVGSDYSACKCFLQ
jgi:hypothetical protein